MVKTAILQEATLTFKGESLTDWLGDLQNGAIAAASAVLPTAQAGPRGNYPDQYAFVPEVTAEAVLVQFCRYEVGPDDYTQATNFAFRVPWTSTEEGITYGTPEPVQLVTRVRAVALDARIEEAVADLAGLQPDIEGARQLLAEVSGKHPAAPRLVLALAEATRK